jgi:hypothetical protein
LPALSHELVKRCHRYTKAGWEIIAPTRIRWEKGYLGTLQVQRMHSQ